MLETIPLRDGGWLLHDPEFIAPEDGLNWFSWFCNEVEWKQELSRGRPFPRLNAYFADPGIHYSYSGVTHLAQSWPARLLELKARVEKVATTTFNSLLVNRYRDGADSMGFHTDYDSQVGPNPMIASVTFGAVRKFVLKHIETDEKLSFDLANGSLLVMAGTSQHHYHHAVPKTAVPVGERINLTFRRILFPKSRS